MDKYEINGLKELLMAIISGGIISLLKAEIKLFLYFFVGLMVFWHFIDITQRVDILIGGRPHKMDLQIWYILVDFTTMLYVVFSLLSSKIGFWLYRSIGVFLALWLLFFTSVEVNMTPMEHPNGWLFHSWMIWMDVVIIGFMLYTEFKKREVH